MTDKTPRPFVAIPVTWKVYAYGRTYSCLSDAVGFAVAAL